ncbi:thiamine pyrophosphate-binding protein [Desulfosporosinus youngiae]|uniref:Thiamine pyrophosphate-dependent enzyme, possible carboligase or decarboxylase n=1 Tax=Desulfosporosinus youngiae DSM 17734 TaxID=768710 RepID=H5XYU8_9FIRM|nr:thiamine pyrophosphate-binding protein [Desulfosporosinus youngiae]EHQ91654.1 thiamine pyrophosphate-dependent enzyme, possible carboligase or decarboxylase [Desulfosporosinus youngiae DSM 17734]
MVLWGTEGQVKHYFADELNKEVEMTGAQFIVKFLEHKRVTHVYGIPEAAMLSFYEAVLEREQMHSINVRQEQTAIFMADGYARSTGKAGICATTSGFGVTDFLTGLDSAYRDSIPLIAFVAQASKNLKGRDGFQEGSMIEMARPVTKAAYLVTKTADLPKIMSEAWKLATQGRKGPVLIDIPPNVQKGLLMINFEDYMEEETNEQDDLLQVTELQLQEVLTMIEEAERPVLMAGEGVAHGSATEELIDLAQLLQIPVISSVMGKDGFPNYHRLYAGMAGTLCQTPLGCKTLLESDLIMNLGGRFATQSAEEMDAYGNDRKIIHIAGDEKEILSHVSAEVVIAADLKKFVRMLNRFIRSRDYKPTPKALERIESLQIERAGLSRQTEFESGPLKPERAIAELRKGLRPDAIVTLDNRLIRIWAGQLYETYEPRTFLVGGRAGNPAWGIGAALGAQLAYPERQVVNLIGNAGLSMSLQELSTAAKHNIPIVVVVLQKGLGLVNVAKGMGVEAELVERPEQIADALVRAFSSYRPYLIEILVDTDEQYPVPTDETRSA